MRSYRLRNSEGDESRAGIKQRKKQKTAIVKAAIYATASLLACAAIVEQDCVGFGVRAHDAESLAIGRVFKKLNRVAGKMCNLPAARAIEGLDPQIFRATLANGIYDGGAIGGKARR